MVFGRAEESRKTEKAKKNNENENKLCLCVAGRDCSRLEDDDLHEGILSISVQRFVDTILK